MANPTLFKSSVFLGITHWLPILAWQMWQLDLWLTVVYAIGVITSLINHGRTSELYKWADRAWMGVGCATDLAYILLFSAGTEQLVMLMLLMLYVGAFFLAKLWVQRSGALRSGNLPHLVTHIGATVLHLRLLYMTQASAALSYR